MTKTWLLPEWVFDGETLLNNKALCVSDGKISDVVDADQAPSGAVALAGIVAPGFLDLQVNGGGGTLFNQTPTPEGVASIAQAHRAYGTVGILPTVITDTPDVLAQAVEAAIAAKGTTGILGVHIEGPHISVPRRGTHSAHFVRAMDDDTIAHVARLRAAEIPVMITVAPETTSCTQIAQLADLGAIVSIGHSDASSEQTQAAIEAGVTCATHLFNAMSPMLNRAPGVTGAVINSHVTAGIIADGIHVADDMIALAVRARPKADLMFIVSDAMPTVGGPDHFNLYGNDVYLKDGQLVNAEGSLAGAHLTQAQGVHHLVNAVGLSRQEALRMAVTIPASVIGRSDLAALKGRALEDVIQLANDMSFAGFLSETLAQKSVKSAESVES
ncbi:N-acetylglucosamine-6-phosphate deacetylase [Cognatishimia sp.]|uniref:N-acetylglucosamine-6-phosphate deacetylase n=1 Tax=Cognatishimia sp. TaxID=2211648 RepID=UPI0035199BB3